MYSLYYDYFKNFYNENCSLLYIDTDSLIMEIKCDNVYNDLKLHFHNIVDFSNYDKDFVLHSISHDALDLKMYDFINKSKLGKLKNEYCFPVKEFIGLKCKLYSVAYGDIIRKKAKGIKKLSKKFYNKFV